MIMPLALPAMIPALGNQWIISIKDTSLFIVIGVAELTRQGQEIIAGNFRALKGLDSGSPDYLCRHPVPELSAEATGEKDPYFMSMVEFSAVAKHFRHHQVLHDINLKIDAGEVVVIIGPSVREIDAAALYQ
jgi:ABC-type multidrug transport system fused ATPase/permease subunit